MRSARYKLSNITSINNNTCISSYAIESCRKFIQDVDSDSRKGERLTKCMCKACFYRKSLAGQAFTERQCAMCITIIVHPNTSAPLLCNKCSKKLKLCVKCCGDINGKKRIKNIDLSWREPDQE